MCWRCLAISKTTDNEIMMSTDVYFDFYSPELWKMYLAFVHADNTNGRAMPLLEAMMERQDELELRDGVGSHYDVCRVGYLSNFIARCNEALWDRFERDRWYFVQITAENIAEIVADWTVIYDNSQKPENAVECYAPDDISEPDRIRIILTEHIGQFLDIRVD